MEHDAVTISHPTALLIRHPPSGGDRRTRTLIIELIQEYSIPRLRDSLIFIVESLPNAVNPRIELHE